MKISLNFNFRAMKVNRVIRYFVLADLLFLSGWGTLGPIFSIFVLEEVAGATLFTVGAIAGFYWLVRACVQVPAAVLIDKWKGEKDDFYVVILSLMLAGFAAMAFLLVDTIATLFLVQAIHALAFGLYTPSWSAIFSRHLDKKHYAFDWSLDHTAISVAYCVTSFFGGAVAQFFGYAPLFIAASILSFTAALLLFAVPDLILPKTTTRNQPFIKDHRPININK